jgi:cytochrome P450
VADHSALRGVVSRWFTPRTVGQLRADVEELARKLVAPLTAVGEGDFAELVTRRVPGPVFCWMMGLPEEEGDHLFDLSAILLKAFSGDPALAEQLTETSAEMRAFVDGLVDRKRAEPGEDLASIMIAAADRGEIEEDDVRSLAFELLTASTDNTHNSAALMFNLLAQNPDQWELAANGTADPADVVEECLRYEPTVVEDIKLASRDTTLLDVEVPEGTMVWVSTLGAHFDPDVYPDPHRFDVTRKHAQPQLNFGIGRHYCTGAALARMELAAILAVGTSAWEKIELAGEPEIDRSFGTKISTLPLRVTPRSGNGASSS